MSLFQQHKSSLRSVKVPSSVSSLRGDVLLLSVAVPLISDISHSTLPQTFKASSDSIMSLCNVCMLNDAFVSIHETEHVH